MNMSNTKKTTKNSASKENYRKCAELFKIMSNEKRLQILDIIKDKEVTVNEISDKLGIRKSNTSQHLSYLRYTGVVVARRDGKNIFYKLVDPRLVEPSKIISSIKIKNLLV